MSLGQLLRPINRLEQILQAFENRMLLTEALVTKLARHDHDKEAMESMKGMVLNWRNLRKAFLARKPLGPEFDIPSSTLGLFLENSAVYKAIPEAISAWTRTSRRIWGLSEKAQKKFELTSLGKLTWSDIDPPFPSFAITLPIPIPLLMGGEVQTNIDFIHVAFQDGCVRLMLLCQNLSKRMYLPERKAEEIKTALDTDNFRALDTLIRNLNVGYFDTPSMEWIQIKVEDKRPIADDMDAEFQTSATINSKTTFTSSELSEYWKLSVRIVAGLCLHLKAISKNNSCKPPTIKIGKWNKLDYSNYEAGMVTSEAQVCLVDTTRLLAPEEEEAHRLIRQHGIRKAHGVNVHYRSGYWRALPGHKGEKKCVEVDWTIVNNRSLKTLALPHGSEVVVRT